MAWYDVEEHPIAYPCSDDVKKAGWGSCGSRSQDGDDRGRLARLVLGRRVGPLCCYGMVRKYNTFDAARKDCDRSETENDQ